MKNTDYSYRDREISNLLQRKRIVTLEDLESEKMAKKLNMFIEYVDEESYVRSIGDFALIKIDKKLEHLEKRRIFFHEVVHALYHPGDQKNMPPELSIYQEEQSNYLMLYLAMPIHIIEPLLTKQHSIDYLQELFDIPMDMVEKRLEYLKRERTRSVYQTKLQYRSHNRKKSLQPGQMESGTIKILEQLRNQVGQERMSSDVTRLL